MPGEKLIEPEAKLFEYILDDSDYNQISPETHIKILELLILIRLFEEKLLDLKERGLINGPVHSSIGQEAIAAGSGLALSKIDLIGSTHRSHHHFLGKVIPYFYPENYNPLTSNFSIEMCNAVEKTMYEIMGLKYGWCGGRGGSMHLKCFEAGVVGTNAIVGGGIAITTGAVWAKKLKNVDSIGIAFLGDGAVNQGILLESVNLAKIYSIPIIYLIENNLYAVGTGYYEATHLDYLAKRALGFEINAYVVDGMNPAAVYLLVKKLASEIRKNKKPVFIEARTYRFYHHAGRLSGSSLKYRTHEEELKFRKKDPIILYSNKLRSLGLIEEKEFKELMNKIKKLLSRAETKVISTKIIDNTKKNYYIKEECWPDINSIKIGVPDNNEELRKLKYSKEEDFNEFRKLTFVNIMSQVVARAMEKNNDIYILGEEVANFGGGAYNATRFPLKYFPSRVINTPISEAGFVGLAFGASLFGIKPIVEIMFPDFCLVAADQLFNQIAKLRYLYGGNFSVPIIVRTRIATGLGYGAQHSSDASGLFSMFSGWRIIAPSNAFDYVGLFNTALVCNDPVVIMEHHSFYKAKSSVPVNNLDYYIPFGKARKFCEGNDLTVVTYLRGVSLIKNILCKLMKKDISVDGIDLRCLDSRSIDYNCIIESIKKTGMCLVLEEPPITQGIGSMIIDEIQKRAFKYLKAPVFHLTSVDVPIPVSKKLEDYVLIDENKVYEFIIGRFKKYRVN